MIRRFAIFAAALILPQPALAYWDYGHQVVARIAEANVRPATRARIAALLRQQQLLETPTCPARTMAEASVWADCIKGLGPRFSYAASWHYQNVHVCKPFDLKAACRDGHCVSAQIERQVALLKDKTLPTRERVQALAFLIHFVGDLHQPLHCAEDNNDEGGNLKPVCFMGKCWESSGKNYNLHRTWDKLMILHTGLTETRYVEKILERVAAMTGDEVAAVIAGDPVAWAEDAHRVAYERAYKLPATKKNKKNPKKNKVYTYHILGPKYHKDNIGFVEDQLLRGGLRLAAVLDEALQ
jgi:hypothetical protein